MSKRRSALEVAKERAEIEELKLRALVSQRRRETFERAYDAAQPSQYWKRPGDTRSGNAVMDNARATLRSFARHLDENHDLAIGVLDDLTKKIVGCGVQVTPSVKKPGGALHELANEQLSTLWYEWTTSSPEASRTLPWPQIEAMTCRSWLRDGEMLVQHLEGNAPIKHRSRVPYSIELIEADYLPFDLGRDSTANQNRIVHGVELTDWREPVAYWVYKEHPGDVGLAGITGKGLLPNFKRVSAEQITHIKFIRRLGQVRGVSVLHGALRRLEDIKEYEESERVAARVAAALCAAITKSTDFQGATNLDPNTGNRTMEMNPGMVFDNLLPGESVAMIGSDRPNANLENFRNAMMRGVASGTGTSYSGISRNYNGTYSSQRQELVESWVGYELMREYLYGAFYRPIWQRFCRMALAAGLIKTLGVDLATLFDVDFVGPKMPWIDPIKEVEANAAAVDAGFTSRHMVIRESQLDPRLVDEQIEGDPLREKLLAEKKPAAAAPAQANTETKPKPDDDDAAAAA